MHARYPRVLGQAVSARGGLQDAPERGARAARQVPLTTGEPVLTDQQYHHLQIDVISLYLLFLVQMITSGLQIIYTQVWITLFIMCLWGGGNWQKINHNAEKAFGPRIEQVTI